MAATGIGDDGGSTADTEGVDVDSVYSLIGATSESFSSLAGTSGSARPWRETIFSGCSLDRVSKYFSMAPFLLLLEGLVLYHRSKVDLM